MENFQLDGEFHERTICRFGRQGAETDGRGWGHCRRVRLVTREVSAHVPLTKVVNVLAKG